MAELAPVVSGHAASLQWCGWSGLSLEDWIPQSVRLLIIGKAPARASVDAGHYYRGQHGKEVWRLLSDLGLSLTSPEDDCAYTKYSIGFTDTCKRPLTSGERLAGQELQQAIVHVRRVLLEHKPDMVMFPYLDVANILTLSRTPMEGVFPGALWGTDLVIYSIAKAAYRSRSPLHSKARADVLRALRDLFGVSD